MTADYVLDVWLMRTMSLPLPYIHHDVGLPLLMGLLMRVFGSENSVVGWTGGIFYVLTIPLTFLFGWKLYGKAVGLLRVARPHQYSTHQ